MEVGWAKGTTKGRSIGWTFPSLRKVAQAARYERLNRRTWGASEVDYPDGQGNEQFLFRLQRVARVYRRQRQGSG